MSSPQSKPVVMKFQVTPQKLLKFSHNFCISDESQVFYHHDADLCDPNQIAEMFKFIQQKYSRSPDILVNNAGIHAHITHTHTHTHTHYYIYMSRNTTCEFY